MLLGNNLRRASQKHRDLELVLITNEIHAPMELLLQLLRSSYGDIIGQASNITNSQQQYTNDQTLASHEYIVRPDGMRTGLQEICVFDIDVERNLFR